MSEFKTRFTTSWIIVACAAVLIGWDIYAMRTGEGGVTISEIMLTFAKDHPVFPFLFGVLAGHLFWYQEVPK